MEKKNKRKLDDIQTQICGNTCTIRAPYFHFLIEFIPHFVAATIERTSHMHSVALTTEYSLYRARAAAATAMPAIVRSTVNGLSERIPIL